MKYAKIKDRSVKIKREVHSVTSTMGVNVGHILNHELPDDKICKRFGCGKVLSRQEYLASDMCSDCANKSKTDINKFIQI